jgi:hypothetical protein
MKNNLQKGIASAGFFVILIIVLGIIIGGIYTLSWKKSPDISINNSSSTVPTNIPVIKSIVPTSGIVGTIVTIYGSGFLGTSTILFGGGPVSATAPTNIDTSLSFSVPSSVGADCQPNAPCPMYARLITPGTYSISVRNAHGTSNSIEFMVIENNPTGTQY